jgi:hypothetical protein
MRYMVKIAYYERLNKLLISAEARRRSVLQEIECYREELGRQLGQVSDDIVEGEFREIADLAVAAKESRITLAPSQEESS